MDGVEIAFLTPVMPEVRAAIAAGTDADQRLHFAASEAPRLGLPPASAGASP